MGKLYCDGSVFCRVHIDDRYHDAIHLQCCLFGSTASTYVVQSKRVNDRVQFALSGLSAPSQPVQLSGSKRQRPTIVCSPLLRVRNRARYECRERHLFHSELSNCTVGCGFASWCEEGNCILFTQAKAIVQNELGARAVALQNVADLTLTLHTRKPKGICIRSNNLEFLSPYANSKLERFGGYPT